MVELGRLPTNAEGAPRTEGLALALGVKALRSVNSFFTYLTSPDELPRIKSLNLKGPRTIYVAKAIPEYMRDIPLFKNRPPGGQLAIPGYETPSRTKSEVVEADWY